MSYTIFNLASRLGLINPPYRQKELNIGVETGGKYILSHSDLDLIAGAKKFHCQFPDQNKLTKKNYFHTIANAAAQNIAFINKNLNNNELTLFLGGDHSIAFISIASILQSNHNKTIGIIMLDSHTDLNDIHSSPTGNFHGMWLRSLLGSIGNKDIDGMDIPRLKPEQILFIGDLDIDPAEKSFIQKNKMEIINTNFSNESLIKINAFIARYERIHLTLDIDGLNSDIAPATGIPNPNGLSLEQALHVIDLIKSKSKLTSIDIVEFNPKKPGVKTTMQTIENILSRILN